WREQKELSAKTANDYLEAIRCFFNWQIKNVCVQVNPLAWVEKVRTEERETRQRRAFSGEEMRQLLAMVPADRKAVYLMPVHTGLQVRASATKDSKPATMRRHRDVGRVVRE